MANSRTIEFKGHFDGKQVLDELKKIRQNMADAGADDNLFKGIDKDIAATEKLVTEMMAQIQKGFSNTKEVNAFEKQIDKLQTNFLKISSGMKNINVAENLGLNSPEIAKLTREIEQLTNAQDHLKEVSKNALDQAQKSIGLRNDEVTEIKKAIDANEDLEEALKKVGKAKEKAALASVGSKAAKTDAGKEYLSGASVGLSLEDLGATASSGKSVKKKNDARKRYDNGELYGSAGNRELDETKANAAINEAYQKTLEKMVSTGGNAAEAIEEMKKALADYGIEIANVDKLQENFYNDIEGFYKSSAVTGGGKSAVTKARKIGQTDAQGNYQLSESSITNVVNNEEITASSRATQELSQKVQELGEKEKKAQEEAAKAAQKNSESIKNVEENIEDESKALKQGAEDTKDFAEAQQKLNSGFDNIKGAIKTFLSLGSAVNALRGVFNETFESVKTLDESFAQIAMVTDYSVQEMWSSYDQYAVMANELGQSTQSVIQASGLFYQQGLETNEALELTEDTMKLATLAGLDFSEATSQMTAALRGFHMEMNEGGRVTDVYSELAAKAAADVEGIAYAMSKTASIASSAGMEFETTSAFLTQMIETTQEAPENIGTAMKTIIARFTELKENVAGTADSEFEDLDYNKVDTALKSVGVSIKDASGQFRDLDDVFLELSQKWNTLDRNSQRYIATIAAGSRQQSRFIAMMENYDRTVELVNTAYNSSGKSSEQFAKYQDTLQYKINKLQNSWEQLRVSLMDSEFFKTIVDTVGSLVKYLSKLNFTQIIAHIITIVTLLKTVSAVINGIQTGEKFKQIGKTLGNVKGLSGIVDEKMKSRKKKTTEEKIEEGGEKAGQKISDKITSSGKDAAQNMENAIKDGGQQAAQEIAKAMKQQADDNKDEKEEDSKEVEKENTETYKDEEQKRTEIAKIEELQRTKDAALAETEEARLAALAEAEESKKAALAEIDESNTAKRAEIEEAHAAKIAETEEANAAKRAEIEEAHAAQLAEMREGSSGGGGGGFSSLSSGASKVFSVAMIGIQAIAAGASIGSMIGNAIEEKAEKIAEEQEKFYEDAINKINTNSTTSDSNLLKSDTKTLIEAQKTINDLQNKQFLSSTQQSELESAITYMNENHADLVKSYDENTGKIELLNDSIKKQIEAQDANTEAILLKEIGAIGGNRSRGYALASEDYGDDVAQDNQWIEEQKVSNWTTASGVAGGTAVAASLAAIAAASASSAAVAAVVPVVGWIVAGVAAVVAVGTGITAAVISSSQESTQNVEETMSKINQLDADTQDKIISRLNEQGANIDNLAQLESWISEDAQNQQKLLDTATEILDEMRVEAIKDDAELALENYVKSQKYTDATGQEVQVPDIIIEEMITQGSQEEIDFNKKLTDASSGQSDLMLIQDVNTSNEDRVAAMEKYSYTDLEGNIVNLGEIFQSIMNNYKSLLDENGEFKEFDLLTEDLQNVAIKLFGSAEKYSEVAGTAFSETQDVGIVVEDAINAFEGGLTAKAGKDIAENIQSTVKNRNYDSWMAELEKIKLGQEMTPQEAEKALRNLQETMRAAGANVDFVNALWGDDEVEGTNAYIISTWKDAQQNLINQGFNRDLIKSLSAESASTLNSLLVNMIESGFDTKTQNAIKNTYQKAFDIIDKADLTEAQKNKVLNYITTVFNPDTFDVTMLSTYVDELSKISDGAEESGDLVNLFYEAFTKNDITPTIDELGDLEEQLSKIQEALEGTAEDWDSFVNGLESFSSEGITSDLISSMIGNESFGEYFDVQLGQFDMAGAINDFYNKQIGAAQSALDGVTETDQGGINEAYLGMYTLIDAYKEMGEKSIELRKEEEEASKNYAKAVKDEAKAIEDATEAEKAYQEAMHGSEFYVPSLDPMHNYITLLDKNTEKLDKTNDLLSETETIQEKINLLSEKNNLEHDASVLRLAQIETYSQGIAENQKWIAENAGEYFTLLEDGSYIVNEAFYGADMPDAWSEEIIRRVQETEEWITTSEDLSNQEIEAEKNRVEELKKYREDYLSFIEQGAEILKTKAEEEVKITEDKYSALEEADNKYLDALEDAIEKQRKLREQENAYEDLATKQKKLSLMQRDTSGANQKDIQNLEKEVQEDQQNLLDQEIDNMIDGLRDLYESQQDLRNEEIELKNAIIEETNYTKQFANIAATWTSVDDANAFFLENTDTSNMITEEIENLMNTFSEAYNQGGIYMANNHEEVVKFTEATTQEITDKTQQLGNFLMVTTQTTTDSVEQDIREMVADAYEQMLAAKESADDATQAVKDYETELTEAENKRKTWEKNAEEGQAKLLQTMTDNFTQESVELQKITIQALQNLFSDDAIIDMLGLSKDQFEKILNGDLLKSLTKKPTESELTGLSGEQISLLERYRQTKDSKGQDALKQQYINEYLKYSEAANRYGIDTDTLFLNDYEKLFGTPSYQTRGKDALDKNKDGQINIADAVKSRQDLLRANQEVIDQQKTIDPQEEIMNGLKNSGYEVSTYTSLTFRGHGIKINDGEEFYIPSMSDEEWSKIEAYLAEQKEKLGVSIKSRRFTRDGAGSFKEYKTGGLVNYTGPAWVDGTPTKPEAFLNAQDTQRIGEAAKILAQVPALNGTSENVSTNIGDTTIEIHINVESIESDYDVDQMIERVKNDILDVSKPTGTSVILKK